MEEPPLFLAEGDRKEAGSVTQLTSVEPKLLHPSAHRVPTRCQAKHLNQNFNQKCREFTGSCSFSISAANLGTEASDGSAKYKQH